MFFGYQELSLMGAGEFKYIITIWGVSAFSHGRRFVIKEKLFSLHQIV
jgi:hypothetical protein